MYLRLIDSCVTQLKAQGPSRTCNESKQEEEKELESEAGGAEQVRLREILGQAPWRGNPPPSSSSSFLLLSSLELSDTTIYEP